MTERQLPQEDETWRHYKGGLYRIIKVGMSEPYSVPCVVYKSLRDLKVYARPVDNFMEKLEEGYRFEKAGHSAPSDLACFIDLYARFGIALIVGERDDHQLVFLPCNSVVKFDATGKFISQELIG